MTQFFQFIIYDPTMGRAETQPKLSPQTEFGIPPHTTTLPTTTGSSKYNLVVSFHRYSITMSQKKIQFISHSPIMGTAKTQITD